MGLTPSAAANSGRQATAKLYTYHQPKVARHFSAKTPYKSMGGGAARPLRFQAEADLSASKRRPTATISASRMDAAAKRSRSTPRSAEPEGEPEGVSPIIYN